MGSLGELYSQAKGWLLHKTYRLWGLFPGDKTIDIAANARSSKVLSTARGLTVRVRRGINLLGRRIYDEERLGQKVAGLNPHTGKVYHHQNLL